MIEKILVSWLFLSTVALLLLLLLAIDGQELPEWDALNKAGKAVVLLIFLPAIIGIKAIDAIIFLIHDSFQLFKKKQERRLLLKEVLRGENPE